MILRRVRTGQPRFMRHGLGCPTSFKAFERARKGKARAISPVPQPDQAPVDAPSTSADKLMGALSTKFGLPEAVLKSFSSKAIARAQCSSDRPKDPASHKYKPLKGIARDEASLLIDQALVHLLQLSEKHGIDPTAATKLFQKKLDCFSSSLWDMWEIHQAIKWGTNGSDEDNSEEEEEDEDKEEGPSDGTGGGNKVTGFDDMENVSPMNE